MPEPKTAELISMEKKGAIWVAKVRSRRDPSVVYTIMGTAEVQECNCPGSGSPNGCFHKRDFRAALEQENEHGCCR